MDKLYKVFGGYLVDDFTTDSYGEALENFAKRVIGTKPETDARIGIVSAWHDDEGVIQTEVNHFVILPSKETLIALKRVEFTN